MTPLAAGALLTLCAVALLAALYTLGGMSRDIDPR